MATRKTLKEKGTQPADKPERDYSTREARERFERAVDVAVVTKPIHKPAKTKRKGAAS